MRGCRCCPVRRVVLGCGLGGRRTGWKRWLLMCVGRLRNKRIFMHDVGIVARCFVRRKKSKTGCSCSFSLYSSEPSAQSVPMFNVSMLSRRNDECGDDVRVGTKE